MAKEYRVMQLNYQNSMNADDYDEGSKLTALSDDGWEVHTADVSSWPYVTLLIERDKPEPPKPAAPARQQPGRVTAQGHERPARAA